MQEDLQKLPPGFPRGVVPQPPFPLLAPNMGQMHTLMPTQSLQPTQQLEYKVGFGWGTWLKVVETCWYINFDLLLPGAVLVAATYSAAA